MIRDNLIIDIGMHIGRDTEFYLLKGFNVVAIEANPQLVEKAEKKFSEYIDKKQLKILNIGITQKKGVFPFYINLEKDDWSSFHNEWNTSMMKSSDALKTVEVEGWPLDELLQEIDIPYYLKIDIEGNDLTCIKALHEVSELPKYLSVELPTYNNLPNQQLNYAEILSHLNVLGYTKFQIVDQSKHPLTICPKPAKEGKYINYEFDGYSSGLFGKELPSHRWYSIDDVLYEYLYYIKKHHLPKKNKSFKNIIFNKEFYENSLDVNGWFDVHATY